MRHVALVLSLALVLSAPLAAAAAAPPADAPTDAPWCTGYVQVRCFDGANFCQLYVRRVACVHL